MKNLASSLSKYSDINERTKQKLSSSFLTTPEMVRYYELYSGIDAQSLIVYQNDPDIPVASIIFTESSSSLNFFGMPCEVIFHQDLEPKPLKKVISFLFQELKSRYNNFLFSFKFSSALGNFLSSIIYSSTLDMNGVVDLEMSEQEILQSFRKSYRSLINWGKKNLEIKTLEKDIKQSDIEAFQNFHIQVAGRETRKSDTWIQQKEQVSNGLGWINLAYYQGELVSANLILHDNSECFYAVAASNRTLMEEENLPLAHVLIESSIFKAKEIGLKTFSFGDIRQKEDNPSKENSIRKFKSGFCNRYIAENIINLNLRDV